MNTVLLRTIFRCIEAYFLENYAIFCKIFPEKLYINI